MFGNKKRIEDLEKEIHSRELKIEELEQRVTRIQEDIEGILSDQTSVVDRAYHLFRLWKANGILEAKGPFEDMCRLHSEELYQALLQDLREVHTLGPSYLELSVQYPMGRNKRSAAGALVKRKKQEFFRYLKNEYKDRLWKDGEISEEQYQYLLSDISIETEIEDRSQSEWAAWDYLE